MSTPRFCFPSSVSRKQDERDGLSIRGRNVKFVETELLPSFTNRCTRDTLEPNSSTNALFTLRPHRVVISIRVDSKETGSVCIIIIGSCFLVEFSAQCVEKKSREIVSFQLDQFDPIFVRVKSLHRAVENSLPDIKNYIS